MGFLDFLFEPNVEKLKKKGDIDGLIKALSYKKDCHIRMAAAEALSEVGDSKTVKRYCGSIFREYPGQIGDINAVKPLFTAALRDKNADVRKGAAKVLMKILSNYSGHL